MCFQSGTEDNILGGFMREIKPINYAEDYHEMKPSLFRESENLDRLLQALFDVCDVQQRGFLWLSENLLNVDVAQGFHLDFIGGIVGQPRFLSDFNTEPYFGFNKSYQSRTFGSALDPEVGGYWNSRSYFNTATSRQLNDEEYRRLIKARAIYNQSNCTANDLLEVVNLITNSKNNTVQMLRHGLIQINTDDGTGILSYFVDRLLNEDNILPIVAGVRVGLEEARKNEKPDENPDENPTDKALRFLKFNNRVLNKDLGQEIGLLYSINGGEIQKASFQTVTSETLGSNRSVLSALDQFRYVLGVESSVFGWQPPLPQGLTGDFAFIFGFDNKVLNEFFEFMGYETPPPDFLLPEEDFEIKIHPKSVLPNSGLDFDVFDLIVEPKNYTAEDLAFFTEMGIAPAISNSDGSYTIHSKSHIPLFG